MMRTNPSLRAIVDRRLAPVVWTRSDEARVWQALSVQKPARRKLKAAVVIALIAVLLAAVAIAVSVLYPFAQTAMDMEKEHGAFSKWSLQEKQELVRAMDEAGIDISSIPDVSNMTGAQASEKLTQAINALFPSEIASLSYAILENAWGFIDDWTLEQKAWYGELLLSRGMLKEGDDVLIMPGERDIQEQEAISASRRLLAEEYNMPETELDKYSAHTYFYYPLGEPEDRRWRVNYRDSDNLLCYRAEFSADSGEVIALYRKPSQLDIDEMVSEQEKRVIELMRLKERMEKEQGLMITWSLEDKAKVSDSYGVPPEDGLSEADARQIAFDAIAKRYPAYAKSIYDMTAYAYYSIDEESPEYVFNIFESPDDVYGGSTEFSVHINADTREVTKIYTAEDSNG